MEKEILEKLRKILQLQLEKYNKYSEREKNGEVDESYIYDTCYEWFEDLSRGEYCEILALLSANPTSE